MNANQIKDAALAALAAAGALLANLFGGWDAALRVLVAMMAADYITGLAVAVIWRRSNKSDSGAADSRAGFQGLVRKCAVLLLVYIGVLLDQAVGTHYIRSAVTLFFIGNEGLSLLENIGLMGVEYPKFLRDMLQVLHDRGDRGGDGDAGADVRPTRTEEKGE